MGGLCLPQSGSIPALSPGGSTLSYRPGGDSRRCSLPSFLRTSSSPYQGEASLSRRNGSLFRQRSTDPSSDGKSSHFRSQTSVELVSDRLSSSQRYRYALSHCFLSLPPPVELVRNDVSTHLVNRNPSLQTQEQEREGTPLPLLLCYPTSSRRCNAWHCSSHNPLLTSRKRWTRAYDFVNAFTVAVNASIVL